MMQTMIDKDMFIQQLLKMCRQPMALMDLSQRMDTSYSTVYKYIKILEKNHKIIKTLVKGSGTKKFLYTTAEDVITSNIDSSKFVRQLTQAKDCDAVTRKHKVTDEGVVIRNGASTIVNGFDGYHSKSNKSKTSDRTYVSGSTLERF